MSATGVTRDERKAVGRRIDPETATVMWCYSRPDDRYFEGISDGSGDFLGRTWYAADPVERIWVHMSDLPEETIDRIVGATTGDDGQTTGDDGPF